MMMKSAWLMALTLAAAMGAGCQTYEPRPIDAAEHARVFLSRTPDSAQLSAFAASLRSVAGREKDGFDLQDGVTLAEAEAVALVFNAELREARERAGVTRAAAMHAGLWEDPVLGVDLARIVQSVAHPFKAAAGVGLTLPVSGRLGVEKARAGLNHEAELARVAEREWAVRVALRRAWAQWTAWSLRAESAREYLARLEGVRSAVDAAERAGEMPRVEARLVRIEWAGRQAELMGLEADLAAASLEILRYMGLSPTSPVTLIAAPLQGGSAEGESVGAGLGHPRIAVAAAEYAAAERALELEIRRQYPDVTIGPGFGMEEGRDEFRLGLSVPLPLWNANRQRIAEARAGRDAARARVESAVEGVLADLHAARSRLDAARRRRRALEEAVVPLVEAQYADVRRAIELGEARAYVLLESLSRLHEARSKVIDAALEEALAALRVVEMLGPAADTPTRSTQGKPSEGGMP